MAHATPSSFPAVPDLVARIHQLLSTRTLNHFAEEARLDGESLREAVDRYDIDYAWHVLGSARLLDATVAELETGLQQALTAEQRAEVAAALKATAESQAPELLMSFDNDLPQQVAGLMRGWWDPRRAERAAAEAA